jgi:hypothetical protein
MCFMFKSERLQTIDSILISRAITAKSKASVDSFIRVANKSVYSSLNCLHFRRPFYLKSCITTFSAVSEGQEINIAAFARAAGREESVRFHLFARRSRFASHSAVILRRVDDEGSHNLRTMTPRDLV